MFKTGLKNQPFHRPVKRFGQNFLIDQNVINTIIQTIKPDLKTIVVEIGPGTGAITKTLCSKAYKVVAIELDKKLSAALIEEKIPNLVVINKDILEVDFKELMTEEGYRYVIFGNVPYYISSKIIALSIKQSIAKEAIFMVQKEMYERVTAKCKTSDYGSFTVFCNLLSNSEKVMDVYRNSFIPKPNVDSAVIKFTIENKDRSVDISKFESFLKKSFGQKRKMLTNNLKNFYDKQLIIDAMNKLDLEINVRPEEVELEDFIKIYEKLNKD
jgi:16S rRNA (adenine1518-N6/adenine1519-N6)-dimethyltransferase